MRVAGLCAIQYVASETDLATWVCSSFREVSVRLEQELFGRLIITSFDAERFPDTLHRS